MLKTRSLRFEIHNKSWPVMTRRGSTDTSDSEPLRLEFPTVDVEASDATEDRDHGKDPVIWVQFLDQRHHGIAFSLDMHAARTLGAVLAALTADRDVTAHETPINIRLAD
jgi:hypothetical protein